MRPFGWLEGPGQLESLAASVRSLTALAGTPVDYDEAVVALGLGSLVVSDARRTLAEWPALARNELLVATAERSGVRLRDLHPRRAAVGLEASAEYRLHFIDSYLPLIERALASGQLALAWRGWPPPFEMQWGVITKSIDGVSGYTLGSPDAPLDLSSPSQQVYVVEEVEPPAGTPLEAADAFARAAWSLQIQETGAWSSDAALRTGSRAWTEWHQWLSAGVPGPASIRAHCGAAMQVASAREALGRWLRQKAGELSGAPRASAAGWADLCMDAAQRLRGTVAPGEPQIADATHWYSDTSKVLIALAELDVRAFEVVSPHARPIAVRPAYEPNPLQV